MINQEDIERILSFSGDDVFKAVCKDDIQTLASLLERNKSVLNEEFRERSLLSFAVHLGKIKCATFLLEKGMDVNKIDRFGRTALHYAAAAGHVELIDFLIKNNAEVDINAERHEEELSYKLHYAGITALMDAVDYGRMDSMRALLGKGANINATDAAGETALHHAVEFDRVDMIPWLIERAADLNSPSKRHGTPLHYAVYYNKPACLSALLLAGADINATNQGGYTSLHISLKNSNFNATTILVAYGVNLDIKHKKEGDALAIAERINQKNSEKFKIIRLLKNLLNRENLRWFTDKVETAYLKEKPKDFLWTDQEILSVCIKQVLKEGRKEFFEKHKQLMESTAQALGLKINILETHVVQYCQEYLKVYFVQKNELVVMRPYINVLLYEGFTLEGLTEQGMKKWQKELRKLPADILQIINGYAGVEGSVELITERVKTLNALMIAKTSEKYIKIDGASKNLEVESKVTKEVDAAGDSKQNRDIPEVSSEIALYAEFSPISPLILLAYPALCQTTEPSKPAVLEKVERKASYS